MNILEKVRLAEGVELIPIKEVNELLQFKDIDYEPDDFVLNKARSRHRSKIISRDMAMFLKNFEKPSTVIDAVISYAATVKEDPTLLLEDAHPFIMDLVKNELLVFQWDNLAENVFKAGEVFEGYTIVKTIHKIEDTEVYEAYSETEEFKTVIIKVGIDKPEQKRIKFNFDNEVAILSSLSNTVNPKLIKHGEHDGYPYILLQKIENTPVTEYVERLRTRSQFKELVQLMRDVVAAYKQLHSEGVYHIDINPRNLLINEDGKIYIIDFGVSSTIKSKAYYLPGADYFSPPEILTMHQGGGRQWDSLSEQYAVAALIYYLYTGKHYISFSVEGEVMRRQLAEEPVRSFEEQGMLPFGELEQILTRCLQKDPALRYPDLGAVIAGLDALQPASFPVIVKREYPLDNILLYDDTDGLIDKLSSDKIIREYFNRGPSCSIFNGGAGVAYFLYRMALHHQSAELISLADIWCNRSKEMTGRQNAYINKELGFDTKDLDEVSVFNHEPGLHFVQALVSSSVGDAGTTMQSIEHLIRISKSESKNIDMTMGKSSILLALASIVESLPAFFGFDTSGIINYGNSLMNTIWQDHVSTVIKDDDLVKATGIAHGWAGLIYAALRWHRAAGTQAPAWLGIKVEELYDVRDENNDHIIWKNRINSRQFYYMPGWCNGGAGLIELFTLAAGIFKKSEYLTMAERTAIDVYRNQSMAGDLCCGLAGRAYSLLSLYRVTQNEAYYNQANELLGRSKNISSFVKTDSLFKGKFGLKLLDTEIEKPDAIFFPCM